jgi:hypothetical protein
MAGIATAPSPAPRGCSLYEYDFRAGRERLIANIVGARRASFYLPTIWRDEIAYVRVGASGRPALVAQPLEPTTVVVRHGKKRVRRRKRIAAVVLPGGDSSSTGPGPVSLDLRAGRLAFAWHGGDGTGTWSSTVYLDTLPATPRSQPQQVALDAEVADAASPGFLDWPALGSAAVAYGRFDASPTAGGGGEFERIGFDGSGPGSVAAPVGLRGEAVDGFTYAMYGPYAGQFSSCGPSSCTIVALRGVR